MPPHALTNPEALWHPTWVQPHPDLPSLSFGGPSRTPCVYCGEQMRSLLLFDPVPPGLGVTSRTRVEIGYCYRCTGAEESFHEHDAEGRPKLISEPMAVFTFQREKFRPAIRVGLADLGPRWQLQDMPSASGRQNLNRLGGEPIWVQPNEYPRCPNCQELMTFLAQLDWELLEDGEPMTYVCWCDPCAISALLHQQT